MALAHNPTFHARAKHIEIRGFYIRNDMVAQNRLRVEHLPGDKQPADILTKQLPKEAFLAHCKRFGIGPVI